MPSLTVEELVETFVALNGEADWKQVQDHIWAGRGSSFAPYKDKGNFDTTLWQLLYRHTPGFAKFTGNALFQRMGESHYRLLDFNPLVPHASANQAAEVNDYEAAARRNREVQEFRRNQLLVRQVKDLYESSCQICRIRLALPSGESYAEAHHIKGLGEDGPDVLTNLLCVCANCHALLDLKAIRLDRDKLFVVPDHTIEQQFLDHHNHLFQQRWGKTAAEAAG